MSGPLYLVSTPIGNPEDMTVRAIRILKEVAIVAAEDTSRTHSLLLHYGIDTPLTSYHDVNKDEKTPVLIRRLHEGQSIALVSDDGTPLISDPGAVLVAQALASGIRVVPVPGPWRRCRRRGCPARPLSTRGTSRRNQQSAGWSWKPCGRNGER